MKPNPTVYSRTSLASGKRLGCGVLSHLSFLALFALASHAQTNIPENLQHLFMQGVQALRSGDLDHAEKAFQTVIDQGGKVSFVHNNLGVVYQQKGDHNRAIQQFRAAVRLQSDYAAPRFLLGASLQATGQMSEAIQHLERALKLEPQNIMGRALLAKSYESVDNLPAMVAQYRKLREMAPKDPEYAYQLGRAYARLSEWCFAKIKRIDPRSARSFQSLGNAYRLQGRTDLAIRAFSSAAEANPHLPEIHLNLAQLYLEQGKKEDALAAVQKELQIVPESAAALALKRRLE